MRNRSQGELIMEKAPKKPAGHKGKKSHNKSIDDCPVEGSDAGIMTMHLL